jgi:PLP dependent protein
MMIPIEENLAQILESIRQASDNRKDVKLIAVSKTKPVELILRAFKAGQISFGENRVQEARAKSPQLPETVDWHLIGPLQKNKAKYCPSIFSTIHTLHNLEVAQLLSKKCQEKNSYLNVLIQMNLSGEETKSGLRTHDELKQLADQIIELPNIKLTGLMTIGDPGLNDLGNQKIFARLRELLNSESARLGLKDQIVELSAGMTSDYQLALKEGATLIRVGSAIFGERFKVKN